jgi:hypothetical protein
MNTEGLIHPEEEPTRPIVQWFPPGGMAQAAPGAAAAAAALVLGALVYAGFALARAAMNGAGRRDDD